MTTSSRHIVLINAIYPPTNGASGEVANRLVGDFIIAGLEVTVVTTHKNYSTSTSVTKPKGHVIRLKSSSTTPSSKIMRLIQARRDSRALLKKALSIDADLYIICTDPPLLNWYASKMFQNQKWVAWTMDLFPEAFVANGLVSENNLFYKIYKTQLSKHTPDGLIGLGKAQLEYLNKNYFNDIIPTYTIPCGIVSLYKNPDNPEWKQPDKITLGYCGNLGEAHSADFLYRLISLSDPKEHQFVLRVFGAKARAFLQSIESFPNVTNLDWIAEEDLSHLSIQIVTLLKEWTHICVPSKAISAICLETPILFHGDKTSDIYDSLLPALWHIDDDTSSLDRGIQGFYQSLTVEEIKKKEEATIFVKASLYKQYQDGITQITKFIENE